MKISKLYSSDKRFRTIKFNDGFNVVLGRIIDTNNLNEDSHNLGKSTLVELIDFMLLKDLSKDSFIKKHFDKFKNHVFYIELKFEERDFVTIRRAVKNHSKIDMMFHEDGDQDFSFNAVWDLYDLPLTSKILDKNPKSILNQHWGFNETLDYGYRNYLNYFLRTQYDYDKVFKLSKYHGKDSSWKPQLASMLGFNGEIIKMKYEIEAQLNQEKELLENMERELKISLSDLNRINTLLDVTEKKRDEKKEKIDNFDFYFRERELNKELIDKIEAQISRLNTLEYKLRYEINEIKEALKSQNSFNLERIEKLFNQVQINFPDHLKKQYVDLVSFNKQVTDERNKYLLQNLHSNEKELTIVLNNLEKVNNQRNEVLSVLKEKDSFVKFKKYQQEIVEIENEISNLLNKLENYETIKAVWDRINQLEKQLELEIDKVTNHMNEGNKLFRDIQITFTNLVERILSETAIIYHTINTNNNVEFIANITSAEEKELTARADGYSYKKMLCVCFDIAVLLNYNLKKFFKFVYHDGSLESMADTKKITYLETVKQISKTYGIQYILTTLEDNLPIMEDGTRYEISNEEIAIVLDNREDDSGRLFGFSF